jgi:hypothetical protein
MSEEKDHAVAPCFGRAEDLCAWTFPANRHDHIESSARGLHACGVTRLKRQCQEALAQEDPEQGCVVRCLGVVHTRDIAHSLRTKTIKHTNL